MQHKNTDWPSQDLETVGPCPLCGGHGNVVLTELTDIVFGCAQGKWSMKSCTACGSGYLDPRPTPSSIHRAYEVYYTHGKTDDLAKSALLPKTGLLFKAINGRLNLLYGLQRQPSSKVLGQVLRCVPFISSAFDPLGRSLHKPPHPGAKLLDYGCGDGRFLLFAREMGWSVVGVDFDDKAVSAARNLGLDVRQGGFEALKSDEQFDAVTLSHVIEHVHDPMDTLKKCYAILNPNGVISLETPNFDAYGRRRFGAYWRGLEVPRHLVIFTEQSLHAALSKAGFSNIDCVSRNFVSVGLHADSRQLARGDALRRKTRCDVLDAAAWWDGIKAIFKSTRREFLKFNAQKKS
jgi:2-polyprenyl-3-methyl-5-hydroxy-6-metoxy-1,4-benzoquinol methylase